MGPLCTDGGGGQHATFSCSGNNTASWIIELSTIFRWWPRPCLGSGGEKVEMTKMFSMLQVVLEWQTSVSRDCDTIRERESPRLSLGAKNKSYLKSPDFPRRLIFRVNDQLIKIEEMLQHSESECHTVDLESWRESLPLILIL